jgi:hypothetical protein
LKIPPISLIFLGLCFSLNLGCCQTKTIKTTTFQQEKSQFYTIEDGLPSLNVYGLTITIDNTVYAGTELGLIFFEQDRWHSIVTLKNFPIWFLTNQGNTLIVYSPKSSKNQQSAGSIYVLEKNKVVEELILPRSFNMSQETGDLAVGNQLYIGNSSGVYSLSRNNRGGSFQVTPISLNLPSSSVRQLVVNRNENIFAATDSALFRHNPGKKEWIPIHPVEKNRSWALADCRGVSLDHDENIWFAGPQGVGCFNQEWILYEGKDGLPYNDFTCVAKGEKGIIWFGTQIGAIRFDGKDWEYRQGKRWLPDDHVKDIVVTETGDAWFATSHGIGVIKREPMTLAEKAQRYEADIDRYHRRTPYEYVLDVVLKKTGDKSEWIQHDSDNDGLWTSMYGAGECFAYAATKDLNAKTRATKAFEALKFLGEVTQGGEHSPPPGYVARTILPTSGPDPNIGRIERDIREKENDDKLWKIIDPRWPKSRDGKWYWKCDTSSDELDGHYFFYGLYYDLVADSETEKDRVRKHVVALTDHLVKNNFNLIDHDGKPTRWARYSPEEMNFDKNWFGNRGLNSLSILSYLATAEHMTGDTKYRLAADELIKKHGYLQNLMDQKYQRGIGTGNQSDDEMAFMSYYNLLKYERDPERKSCYALSFWQSWRIEKPEMNPFFNFAFAASCKGLTFTDAWGTYPTEPDGEWLEDAVETLKRFPLDRINWAHQNSHRLDVLTIHEANQAFDERGFKGKGYRVNGKVIPVDECFFSHWNRDPWQLNSGGDGRVLADGAVFLLPYYMGLYFGFIEE